MAGIRAKLIVGPIPNADRDATIRAFLAATTCYRILLRPLSNDEGVGWLATMPDLPGCTGDGETEIEAIEDVRRAALEWADAATRDGDPVPPPAQNAVAAE